MPLPILRVQNLGGSLNILYVDNTELTRDKRFTYLSEDVVSGATTIRVQSVLGFESLTTSSGQIVCIGEIGQEKTEVLRTSQSTSIYGYQDRKEITLRDSMAFDHPQDRKVFILDWNRIEFNYATTIGGTKTTIAAYPTPLQPDQFETTHRDSTLIQNRVGQAEVFYFARLNDNIESRNSDWSDAVYSGGYDDNTVYMVKKRAVEQLGEEVDGKIITHEFLNQSLWEARREYHNAPGKRPFRRKFNTDIGNALTGSYRIELPNDVERPYTAENIYGVRIGANANMTYYDKKEWDFDYRNKPHTTLDHAYTYNTSTSIWLANGRDFAGSVTINVEGLNIGLTRITGLTGDSFQNSFRIYSHPTGGYSALTGSDVFANVTLGLPDKFAVWADPEGSAYIYFNMPIDTAYVNQNIYADYYRKLLPYDSDGDTLDEPKFDFYVDFLKAKIKQRKSKGTLQLDQDGDYKLWEFKKREAITNEQISTNIRIEPGIDHLSFPS